MTQFFIGLYDYFERHKILFYLSLISCVLLMGFFSVGEKLCDVLFEPYLQGKESH